MSRCVAIHSLVFSLVILFQFATADDLELLSNSVSLSGLKDFLVSHQQSQISNKSINNVSDDGSPNAMSQADYDGKEQSDINDKSSSQTSNFGHALLELPLVSSSSNLTAQPSNYVASETASDEEATEPLYKEIGNANSSVRMDNEEESQLKQNNGSEILDSESTLSDFLDKNVVASYHPLSKHNDTVVQYLPDIPQFDVLYPFEVPKNVSLNTFTQNKTVGGMSTGIGKIDSDLPQTENLTETSSSFQGFIPGDHSNEQQQKEQPLELPKLTLNPDSKKKQQREQPLELPRLTLSQDSPKEQQQREQTFELPKVTLNHDSPKKQQHKEKPLELPKLILNQDSPQDQQHKEQPLEFPKLALNQDSPKELQQKEQPLELPKLTLNQDSLKEQQQTEQQLVLPKLPLYQDNLSEKQEKDLKEQPWESSKSTPNQDNLKEQHQKEQTLNLPKLTLNWENPSDQQQKELKEQLLELPKLRVSQDNPEEQKQKEQVLRQPLDLPELPLYHLVGPDEQEQQHHQQSLKLPKLHQYGPKEQQQPLHLPKQQLYQDIPQEQQQQIEKQPLHKQLQQQHPLDVSKPQLYQYAPKQQQEHRFQQQNQPLDMHKSQIYPYGPTEKYQQRLQHQPLKQQQFKHQQQQQLKQEQLPLQNFQQLQYEQINLPKPLGYQYDPNEQQLQQQQQLQQLQQLEHKQQPHLHQQQLLKLPQPPMHQYSTEEKQPAELLKPYHYNQGYSKTGGSMQSSDENSKDSAELNDGKISSNSDNTAFKYHLSHSETPFNPLNKQSEAENRQKAKWRSLYKFTHEDQNEGYQEQSQDEGYNEDDNDSDSVENSNLETGNSNIDDGYDNGEDFGDEGVEQDNFAKSHADDDDNDIAWNVDSSEGDERDSGMNHLVEDVVDEDMAKMNRPPTAPTSMVVFYTWMIVAILIFVVGISMYQSRHGIRLRFPGTKASSSGSDRKRLLDHEFV